MYKKWFGYSNAAGWFTTLTALLGVEVFLWSDHIDAGWNVGYVVFLTTWLVYVFFGWPQVSKLAEVMAGEPEYHTMAGNHESFMIQYVYHPMVVRRFNQMQRARDIAPD